MSELREFRGNHSITSGNAGYARVRAGEHHGVQRSRLPSGLRCLHFAALRRSSRLRVQLCMRHRDLCASVVQPLVSFASLASPTLQRLHLSTFAPSSACSGAAPLSRAHQRTSVVTCLGRSFPQISTAPSFAAAGRQRQHSFAAKWRSSGSPSLEPSFDSGPAPLAACPSTRFSRGGIILPRSSTGVPPHFGPYS